MMELAKEGMESGSPGRGEAGERRWETKEPQKGASLDDSSGIL